MKTLSTLFYIFFLWISIVCGQEICNNGIDDDGDGLVDCYDNECGDSVVCEGFFVSTHIVDTVCSAPINVSSVEMERMWQTNTALQAWQVSSFFAADIDKDSIVEVVAVGTNQIKLINGVTGAEEQTINPPSGFSFVGGSDGIAIGDVDKDGFGEILIVGNNNRILCMNHDGTLEWNSVSLPTNVGSISIADFNQDDTAECFVAGYILNAFNGDLIVSYNGSHNGFSAPVAADVLPSSFCVDCEGLEIVGPRAVLSVDIDNASVTLRSTPKFTIAGTSGTVSVADVDADGNLDIAVNTGIFGGFGGGAEIFVWNPIDSGLIGTIFPYSTLANGTGSRLTVGNLDGDPELELGTSGSSFYIAIDYDPINDTLVELWRTPVSDASSHHTGSTMFDLNCDGSLEIIYRDEVFLHVLDGATGIKRGSSPCESGTGAEYPTIVDLNGDGQANILCGCNTGGSLIAPGRVVAFKSSGDAWVPTRKVWNQGAYSAVNINDDLSIPRQQQYQAHPSLPQLNAFLNQPSLLDKFGNPLCIQQAPNLAIDTLYLFCDTSTNTASLNIDICNISKIDFSDTLFIAMYDSNPNLGGTLVLDTFAKLSIFQGACQSVTFPLIGNYNLFVVLNDDGSDPMNAPTLPKAECVINNVDSMLYSSISITLTDFIIEDYYCFDAPYDTLQAIPKGGVFSGPGLIADSILDISLLNIGETYTMQYTYENSIGCTYMLEDSFIIGPIIAVSNDTSICSGSVMLNVTGNASTANWRPSSGLDRDTGLNVIATPDINMTYYVEAIDSHGCAIQDSIAINIIDSLFLDLGDTSLIKGKCIELADQPTPSQITSWQSIISALNDSLIETSYCPETDDIISFFANDSNMCSYYGRLGILVIDPKTPVFPKAFSPNGDGLNSTFTGINIESITNVDFFRIWDRWGNLVFESSDISIGWDGTSQGKSNEMGIYYWEIAYTNILSEEMEDKGVVALIR